MMKLLSILVLVSLETFALGNVLNQKFLENLGYKNDAEIIRLHRRGIKSVDSKAFWEFKNLKFVSLVDNEMTALPRGLFEKNVDLESIDIREETVTDLPEDIFWSNKNVRDVMLTVGVKNLPETLLKNMPKLFRIELRYNKFETLPVGLFLFNPKLEGVHFEFGVLKEIPENLFLGNPELRYVFFDFNQLTTLPEMLFSNNHKLDKVYMRYNKISTVPEKLFLSSPLLDIVALTGNNLKELPSQLFVKNSKLEKLMVCRNRLVVDCKQVPEVLSKAIDFCVNGNDCQIRDPKVSP